MKVFDRDSNIPKHNMGLKARMVKGYNAIRLELKNKLKVKKVSEVDKWKESGMYENVIDNEIKLNVV